MNYRLCLLLPILLVSRPLPAQQTTATSSEPAVSSLIDEHGTAYITRIVPVPETISREAQESLVPEEGTTKPTDKSAVSRTPGEINKQFDLEIYRSKFPVNIASDTIAGVPVYIVTPLKIPPRKADRVLINLHGGGFTKDSGSLIESVPIANLTQTKVVSVLYRLAPNHPFPAAVDDTVVVYKELLKTYKPKKIAIYGSSAGAVLTPEVAVRIKRVFSARLRSCRSRINSWCRWSDGVWVRACG